MTRKSLLKITALSTMVLVAFAVPQWGAETSDKFPYAHLSIDRFAARFSLAYGSGHRAQLFAVARLLPMACAGLFVASIFASAHRRRWDLLAVSLVGFPSVIVTVEEGLKPLIGRTSYGHLMYPSGHASVAAAAASCALVVLHNLQGKRVAKKWAPVLVTLALLEAVILVACKAHTLTDTIGGLATGVGSMTLIAAALLRSSSKYTARHIKQRA
jgi:membrane-associated phospholipid phosphatase